MRVPLSRGILVGALLAYYLDPRRGRQRRSRLIDRGNHLRRELRRLIAKSTVDAENRMHGLLERMRGPTRTDAGDHVIEARVRAHLGRVVGHSSAIEVHVDQGRVTLSGPILEPEVASAVRHTKMIPGVKEVIDRLDRHTSADVPALQGQPHRGRGDQWTPAAQGLALISGSVIALAGLRRQDLGGLVMTVLGGTLVARAAVNEPITKLANLAVGREGIEVEKTLIVRAPVGAVFDMFSELENLPRFMDHVRRLEIDRRDPMRSRWTVDGPAGVPITFEALSTHLDRPREIAWTTVPKQAIEHTGIVRFEEVPEGTRVHLHMTYRPPGGLFTHGIAKLLGWDPKARIDDDLNRLKSLLEDGHTRAHHERVGMEDLMH